MTKLANTGPAARKHTDALHADGPHEKTANKSVAGGYPSLDDGGKVPTVQLGGPGADATKFLRGDQVWAPGGGLALTTKGDLHSYGTVDVRLPVGADGEVLISDSTEPAGIGLDWKARSGVGGLSAVSATAASGTDTKIAFGDHRHALGIGATKGNVLVHDGATWVVIPVGANAEVLTADSAEASGVKWAAGAGGAPTGAQYLVVTLDPTLTDERRLQVTAPLTLVDGGAGGDLVIGGLDVHEAAADPHVVYQKESEKGAANGYAPLDAGGLLLDSDIPAGLMRDAEHTAIGDASPHHAAVTLSGVPTYITLSGQDIIRGLIDLTSHVTGLLPSANIAADIARDIELHAQVHVLGVTGPHTGLLPWVDLNKTGSSLAELATRAHGDLSDAPVDAHHPQVHGAVQHTAESDAAAIHDNVAAEISAITEKVTPVDADLLVIEDSAAGNAKKRVQIGNLPGGGGANHNILDGSVHLDSVLQGVTAGSLIFANATPKWDELVKGVGRQMLQMDPAGDLPEWTSNIDIPGTMNVVGITNMTGNVTVVAGFSLVGGVLGMDNGTANRIEFGAVGVGAPGASSAGLKIKVFGTDGPMAVNDYAIGLQGFAMWFNTDRDYRWYVDSVEKMVYDGVNSLLLLRDPVRLNVGQATTGEKIRLFGAVGDDTSEGRWGFGIENFRFIMFMDKVSDGQFSFRQTATTVDPQQGPVAVSIYASGGMSVHNPDEGGTANKKLQTVREVHTLALAATSDTTINLPSGVKLVGASFAVNTAVTDDAGDDTWSAEFHDGASMHSLASGATPGLNTKVNALIDEQVFSRITDATTNIRFTPNGGSFTAGVIEVIVYYEDLTSLADV